MNGLVLAGGKSSRMQKDKGSLEYHGKKQSVFCYELLSKYCKNVFLSAREGQSIPKELQVIYDNNEYSCIGPLGGILSAMTQHPDVAWLVLACDLPFLDKATIENLIKSRNPQKIATAYISQNDGLPEPLCAIYEPWGRKHIEGLLKQDIKCPRKVLINSDVELLELLNAAALDNVNTPQEHKTALNILKNNEL